MFTKKTGVLWIGLSQLVLLLVNYSLLKKLTISLSVADFGYFSLCMSIVLFVRQILYDPISITVAKSVGASSHDFGKISVGFKIIQFATDRLGLAVIFIGLAICLLANLALDQSIVGLTALICTFYLCANGAQGIYINLFNSFGDRKAAALFSITDSILKIFLVYFTFSLLDCKLTYVIAAIAMGAFIVFVSMRLYVDVRFSEKVTPSTKFEEMVKQSIFMSAPLYFPTILVAFKSIGDRWLLASFTGVDELAMYSVLQQLAYYPILLLFGVTQTFFGPAIYRLSANDSCARSKELKKLLNGILILVLIVTCAAAGVAIFTADLLLSLFTGNAYRNLAPYMPFFIISGGFAAATGILQVAAIGIFEANIVGKLMSLSVFLNIAIAVLLIFNWGFIGSVAAILASSASSASIYYFVIYRYFSSPARKIS